MSDWTVSLKLTAICIIDRTGKIEREGVVASDPEAIATFIKLHAPHVVRIGLETGATSTWLWTELNKMGLPVICIDARRAKAALKMQINKSDRNDAVGIARIMQCGWYKEVRVKDLDSHATKALLVSRALLVKIKRDIENQIRGLLKNLGLVIGRAKMNTFAARAVELAEDRPELAAAVDPLLKAREAVEQQILGLDRKVCTLGGTMGKDRERLVILKTGQRTILLELGLGGKSLAKSSGWDENQIFLEGDVLEVAVRNGRWVLTHGPAKPGSAPPPAQHYFPTEE